MLLDINCIHNEIYMDTKYLIYLAVYVRIYKNTKFNIIALKYVNIYYYMLFKIYAEAPPYFVFDWPYEIPSEYSSTKDV